MANSVRYKVNDDNSLLRFVLHELWEYKCYWCNTPKDYNDIQIDHIIPQTTWLMRNPRYDCLSINFGNLRKIGNTPHQITSNGPSGR